MTTVYRSKIGWELILLLAILLIPALIASLDDIENTGYEPLFIILGVNVFIITLLFTIKYKIDGTTLRIYAFFIPYHPIDINSIVKIERTFNPLSAPAASIDRLAITHGDGYMLVSPKDKAGFIAALQRINPHIVYNLKKKS